MKSVSAIAICVLAFALIPAISSAQETPPAGAVSPKAGAKDHKKLLISKLDPTGRKAMKDASGAAKLLEMALPIYDGHRILALDLIKEARAGVLAAYDPADVKTKNKHGHKGKGAVNEGHDKSKFTDKQIMYSQKSMDEAQEKLALVISALEEVAKTNNAASLLESIKSYKEARDEIALGIALHKTP